MEQKISGLVMKNIAEESGLHKCRIRLGSGRGRAIRGDSKAAEKEAILLKNYPLNCGQPG
jgi:hypothetical protein